MEFAAAALGSIATGTSAALTNAAAFGAAELIGGGTAAGFSAASAGMGAAAASGATLLGALGQTSTWATILQGGATVGSVLAAQRAGQADAWKLDMAARDAEIEIGVEEVKGLERRNSIKAALVEAIGERDVAAAASGLDLTFGTPALARREAQRDAERALGNDLATEEFRKARLRERAANYRIAAGQARSGALAKAAGLALTGAASMLRRG